MAGGRNKEEQFLFQVKLEYREKNMHQKGLRPA